VALVVILNDMKNGKSVLDSLGRCLMMMSLVSSGWMMGADLKLGQAFPSLVLPLAKDGSPSSMLAFRGQKTVLHVFASW